MITRFSFLKTILESMQSSVNFTFVVKNVEFSRVYKTTALVE